MALWWHKTVVIVLSGRISSASNIFKPLGPRPICSFDEGYPGVPTLSGRHPAATSNTSMDERFSIFESTSESTLATCSPWPLKQYGATMLWMCLDAALFTQKNVERG